MKRTILFLSFFFLIAINIGRAQVTLKPLPVGSVQPSGWIKDQMQKDIKGFAGHLDGLVPTLFADDIYGKDRLGQHSHIRNLGNNKEGDAGGDDQYQWWNSETQSNWWDGYIRNVFLLQDTAGIKKVTQYVSHILTTQDSDGYIGIYDPALRYHFSSENGELWSKTTMYRGLLAYYDCTKDERVWNAVKKAVDNLMLNYPINQSSPFFSGNSYNGGVSHGLAFTDVLYKLYNLTGNSDYLDYANFLYHDYSNTLQVEKDAQAVNIRNADFKPQSHGVHSYEHIRSLVAASLSKNGTEAKELLPTYLGKIKKLVTVTGGAIGDEWIGGRVADETNAGYEYCSLQELMDSYAMLLQVTGDAAYGDAIEKIFYNAAQGSRHPDKSAIAYLKTDNSFVMDGTKNGVGEKNRTQTRYKYSPAHQDVAVCCNPNAGRITPYFIQNSWMKKDDSTLVLALLGPSVLHTDINGHAITIEVKTNYPYDNNFTIIFRAEEHVRLKLMIRRPGWAIPVYTNTPFGETANWMNMTVDVNLLQSLQFSFNASVIKGTTASGERYFSYGALVYALPFDATEKKGRDYGMGLTDLTYTPVNNNSYRFIDNEKVTYKKQTLKTKLFNATTNKAETVRLIPLSKTILRQVSFGGK